MAKFTVLVCDRCNAQFDTRQFPSTGDWPVQQISLKFFQGIETKSELCKPCRDTLSNWFYKEFLKPVK